MGAQDLASAIMSLWSVVACLFTQWGALRCYTQCCVLQVSAKYAHALFQNTLNLYGYSVRVDYSPQGNPAPSGLQLSTFRKCTLPPQLAFGELSAAGGGTILKRKNRSQDMTMI